MAWILDWILLCCTALVTSQMPPLKVSSILSSPYLMEQKSSAWSENKTYRGYIIDLLEEVKKKAKFNYDIEISPDGTFGRELTPGNWSGTINEIIQENAAFAAGPITITSKRANVVDFSTPFITTPFGIVLRQPDEIEESVSHRLLKVWAPLNPSVWLLLFISFVVTSTILYVVSHFNPYEWRRMSHDGEATLREGESFTCLNSFWFVMSALMWQGYTRAPRSVGGRIIVLSWWLFVVLSISCYIANLSNLLRVEPNTKNMERMVRVKNLYDLASSDIPYVIPKGGAMEEFISKSDARIAQQLRAKGYTTVRSIKEGLEKVSNEPTQSLALIGESMMIKYYLRSYSCKLYLVEDTSVYRQYAFVLPQNSTYLRTINTGILTLDEMGYLHDLQEKWFSSSCRGIKFDDSRPELYEVPKFFVIDVGHFSGAMFALAIGLVFGGLITAIEYLIYKYAEEPEKVKNRAKHVQQSSDTGSESADRLLSGNKSTTTV
ncbi:glutamate receptor 2-like [Ostrea edulis]|uniref:glutamate receptor 2-like n=1 Tax=Ostrea edulis TaxID=37623 RepID=UPI00209520D4|nr:glutamate receptor 2-like [Ostrea edulis]